MSTTIPIIIGVADVRNKCHGLENTIEPAGLMLQAIELALQDCGLSPSNTQKLQSQIDSVQVVACSTWPYDDLPSLLSEKLGVDSKHKHYSALMGNQPVNLLNGAARRIVTGESKLAIMTGAETLDSLKRLEKAKKFPPPDWTPPKKNVDTLYSPNALDLLSGTSKIHQIGTPTQVYPLYENGFRAHRHQTIKDNIRESAELYGDFAKVAEKHPKAWSYGDKAETAESIGTISKKNRMIYFPYPLLMNAMPFVDLAAACVVTSTEYAEKLGIPKSKWIYPLGGAGARDSDDFYDRPNYHSSPALQKALDSGLERSGLRKEDIDMFDLYSCFPIVPKLACQHLGLPLTHQAKEATLLGGLTSFGGAGANYAMHAIAEMVRRLRLEHGKPSVNGMILGNGGVLSYENTVCLSNNPRRNGLPYSQENVIDQPDEPSPPFDEQAEGEAVIETYTVEFDRENKPFQGYVVVRLRNGHRTIANHADSETLQQLSSITEEQIGRTGFVRKCDKVEGRNVFTFKKNSRI